MEIITRKLNIKRVSGRINDVIPSSEALRDATPFEFQKTDNIIIKTAGDNND